MVARSLMLQLRRPGSGARAWLGLVLALALALKLLVPQGWMPGPGGLVLCPDALPLAAGPVVHAGMHDDGHKAPRHALPDHPCAFAGLGLAATPVPSAVAVVAPVARERPPVPIVHQVAVGRGLAAPPPPATGPPVFA
jgi:hypothetical protein